MAAEANNDLFPYRLALVLNMLFLVNYMLWSVVAPSQTVAILMMGALTSSGLLMLGRIRQLWPVFFFWILSLTLTLGTRTSYWDAWAIWMFHAKRIFFDNTLYATLDNYAVFSHNDYPMLYPALAATFGKAIGLWNEAFPKSVISFLYVPPVLMLYMAFRNTLGTLFFLLGAVLVCREYLFNGYADAILAIQAAAVLFFAANISKGCPRNVPLCFALLSTSLAVLLLLKNEGIALAIVTMGVMCLLEKKTWKIYVLSLVMAFALYAVTWKLPLMYAQVSNDLATPGILGRVGERIVRPQDVLSILIAMLRNSALLPILLAGVITFFRVPWKEYRMTVYFTGIYSAVLFVVYLSTPHSLVWHLSGDTVERITYPINIVCLATLIQVLLNELNKMRGQSSSYTDEIAAAIKSPD